MGDAIIFVHTFNDDPCRIAAIKAEPNSDADVRRVIVGIPQQKLEMNHSNYPRGACKIVTMSLTELKEVYPVRITLEDAITHNGAIVARASMEWGIDLSSEKMGARRIALKESEGY